MFDNMRYDTIRYDTIRCDAIRYDTMRYDTIRYLGFSIASRYDFAKFCQFAKFGHLPIVKIRAPVPPNSVASLRFDPHGGVEGRIVGRGVAAWCPKVAAKLQCLHLGPQPDAGIFLIFLFIFKN